MQYKMLLLPEGNGFEIQSFDPNFHELYDLRKNMFRLFGELRDTGGIPIRRKFGQFLHSNYLLVSGNKDKYLD